MQFDDLGQLTGEIFLFGGPYSNLQATRAMLEVAAQGTAICTGDVVAYCGSPHETVALVQDAGIPVVAGNCEKQLAAGALDCGCGFEEGTVCDVLSAGWFAHASRQVTQDQRDWMSHLPDLLCFEHSGRRFCVVHGGVSDVARFIWSVDGVGVFEEELLLIKQLLGDVDVVISGHSGIAFVREIGPVQWVNAGVIGMPPNDGLPETEYVRLGRDGKIHLERLVYDTAGARAAMERAGLTQGYHQGLSTGWWPSEDVLPPVLRRGAQSSLASG